MIVVLDLQTANPSVERTTRKVGAISVTYPSAKEEPEIRRNQIQQHVAPRQRICGKLPSLITFRGQQTLNAKNICGSHFSAPESLTADPPGGEIQSFTAAKIALTLCHR